MRTVAMALQPRANMLENSELCACGLAFESGAGHAYNEAAFRHFLALESKRAERSNRSFVLLLVGLKRPASSMPPRTAAVLFRGLAECVREVDFIGWYADGRTIGAVLAQGAEMLQADVSEQVADRVRNGLAARLPARIASELQVQALELKRKAAC